MNATEIQVRDRLEKEWMKRAAKETREYRKKMAKLNREIDQAISEF